MANMSNEIGDTTIPDVFTLLLPYNQVGSAMLSNLIMQYMQHHLYFFN